MGGALDQGLPPPTADVQTAWNFLEEGVDDIMTRPEQGVSYSRYMALYTVVFNYCASSAFYASTDGSGPGGGSEWNPGSVHKVHWVSTTVAREPTLMGSDLYDALVRYLEAQLKTLKEVRHGLSPAMERRADAMVHSTLNRCTTRPFCGTTHGNGTGTQRGPST